MSLISDALRKARQEAAEREAKERGLETPAVAGYWKRSGRLGVGLILGAVIAIGAAMIGGGMVWWALADRSDTTVNSVPDGGPQDDSGVTERMPESPDEATIVDSPPEVVVPTVAPSRSTMDEVDSPAANEGEYDSGTEAPGESTRDRVEAEPTEDPSPLPKRTPLADGEFVGEAKVGDVTLTLGYLVYRKENPFAQINGVVVRVGAVIEDYVVKKITVDSVELAKGDTKIVIRVQ